MRNGASRAPEQQVERGVVAAGRPHRSAVSLLERQSIPALIAGRARLGNRLGSPQLRSGVRIEGDNEAPTGRGGVGAARNPGAMFQAQASFRAPTLPARIWSSAL